MSKGPKGGAELAALVAQLRAQLGEPTFAALVAHLRDGAAPTQPDPARRSCAPRDDLAGRIEALFAPILARADEKAALLLDAMAGAGHAVADVAPKGLRPTIARLQRRYPDQAIWAAAEAAFAQVRAYGSLRETVV